MKYSYKIFLSIVVILGMGFWGYGYWLMKEIRGQYAESLEESLVDFSNILAAYLSAQAIDGTIRTDDFRVAFEKFKKKNFKANIHGVLKGDSPINSYVTDDKGIVLFDSRDPTNIGKNFSQWNDVYLTLQGKYGARSSRTNTSDPLSSVFYVAAPIQYENKIVGVVSVIKPEKSLQVFIARGRQKIVFVTFLVLFVAIIIAGLFSFWLTRPINALTRYAQKISKGDDIRPPRSTSLEFKKLAKAFDEMRISLEGKKSIENFVQHLSHELKSPLTAITGAAELLKEDMPKEKRDQFLSNIELESARAKRQLEDLLTIASLESRTELGPVERIELHPILNELKEIYSLALENKSIKLELYIQPKDLKVRAEKQILSHALGSLLGNAIEFSSSGDQIIIRAKLEDNKVLIQISDQGPGIPEFAKDRVFEKFYSLERPNSGKKSTGLGLSFVKEAISLHSGEVKILPPLSGGETDKSERNELHVAQESGANILIILKY